MKFNLFLKNNFLKIAFFEIIPGAELEVYKDLNNRLDKLNINHAIFKLFGKYDIAMIYNDQNFEHNFLFKGYIKNIIDQNQIICYQWSENENIDINNEILELKGKYMFITSLKIDPILNKKFGISIEKTIIHNLLNINNNSCKIIPLGTLGWNEIVLLVYYNDIFELIKFMFEIEQININCNSLIFDNSNQNNITQITLNKISIKQVTFFGIGYNLLLDRNNIKNNINGIINKSNGQTAYPIFTISCKSKYWNEIKEDIIDLYSNICVDIKEGDISISDTISINDYSLEINRGNWGSFIQFVIDFREKYSFKILSTTTSISKIDNKINNRFNKDNNQKNNGFINKEKELIKKSSIKENDIFISENDARTIKKLKGENLAAQILNLIYSFGHHYENILLKSTIVDMLPAINKLKRYSMMEEKYCDNSILQEMIRSIKDGALQRCTGVILFLENLELSFSNIPTWIQRIIGAQSFLINKTLNLLDVEWSGFVVLGNTNWFLQRDLSVYSPENIAYYPDKWIGITHEIMHIFFQENPKIMNTEAIELKLILRKSFRLISNFESEDKIGLLHEICCEILDYEFTYLNDIDQYITSTWSYFINFYKDNLWNKRRFLLHFLRTLMVILYHEKYIKFALDKYKKRDILEKIVSLNDTITNLTKNITCDTIVSLKYDLVDREKEIIYDDFTTVYPILEYFHNTCNKIINKSLLDMKDYYDSSELDKILDLIYNGYVPEYSIEYPHLLLRKILNEDLDFNSRIALILFFWHNFKIDSQIIKAE